MCHTRHQHCSVERQCILKQVDHDGLLAVKTLRDRQYPLVPAGSSGKTEVWDRPNVMIRLTSTIVTTTAAAVGATPIAIDCTASAPATSGVTSTNSHVVSTPIGLASSRLMANRWEFMMHNLPAIAWTLRAETGAARLHGIRLWKCE